MYADFDRIVEPCLKSHKNLHCCNTTRLESKQFTDQVNSNQKLVSDVELKVTCQVPVEMAV